MSYARLIEADLLTFPTLNRERVNSREAYLGWHALLVDARGEAKREFVDATVDAFVNHGRWVIECPCGSTPMTHHEWLIACCTECGRIYLHVTFPDNRVEIEEKLLLRQNRANQSWLLGETIADLRLENLQHGVEVL